MKKIKIALLSVLVPVCMLLMVLCACANSTLPDFLRDIDSINVSMAITSDYIAVLSEEGEVQSIIEYFEGVDFNKTDEDTANLNDGVVIQTDNGVIITVKSDGSAYASVTNSLGTESYIAEAGAVDYKSLYDIVSTYCPY